MMNKKSEQPRIRGNNFSKEEELHLIKIIDRYKHIIENKNTDQVTFRQKEEIWQCSCNNSRTIQQIKSKYDNLKTAARKYSAKMNRNYHVTGGGPPDSKNVIYEEVINILNKKTVVGLDNPYDDDNINIEEMTYERMEMTSSDIENIEIVYDEAENQDQDNQDQENIVPSTSTQCRKDRNSWSSYTPRMLKEPKSKKLSFKNKPAPQQRETKTFFALKQQYIEQKIKNLKNEDERKQQKHEKEMELLEQRKRTKEEWIKLNLKKCEHIQGGPKL